MAKLEIYGDLEVADEIIIADAAYLRAALAGSGTLAMALEGGVTPTMRVYGTIRADTLFNLNGTDGITTTFLDADGNTITVTGGIITAKTAP
jgi:hypothetical protein